MGPAIAITPANMVLMMPNGVKLWHSCKFAAAPVMHQIEQQHHLNGLCPLEISTMTNAAILKLLFGKGVAL